MKFILAVVFVILLSGCAFLEKNTRLALPSGSIAAIDSNILIPCDALKEDLTIVTFDDAILVYADLATKYGNCSKKQLAGVKIIKQFGNIK